jgi:hypothetical protein
MEKSDSDVDNKSEHEISVKVSQDTQPTPIIIRSEGSTFNAGIILNETNYDI